MITDRNLKDRELDEIYDWIDSLTLSRPKKNISRDFSDALMMAEVISLHIPKIVELHNYPPTNSEKGKISNWITLNNKVLAKLGITLSPDDCKRLSRGTPMAIQSLLFEFKSFVDTANKEKEEEERRFPDPFGGRENSKQMEGKGSALANKLYTSSKVEQLKEVLSLLKEKIALVERSIDRKDVHIRELEDMLKLYTT